MLRLLRPSAHSRAIVRTFLVACWLLPCVSTSATATGAIIAGQSAPGQSASSSAVSVTDDAGNRVRLQAPARRVIALSPALTETVYAAGGGERLVGVVAHSDFPPAARDLPRVGDALALSVESVLALRPDLILAWRDGNNPRLLARIEALGVPIFYSRVDRLDDIATTLERLGELFGTDKGRQAAAQFRVQLAKLGAMPMPGPPVRVFYQVWAQPLMTVNGQHLVSDLIRRCGGINVFGGESAPVPHVGYEAVVAAAPEVIFASGDSGASNRDTSLDQWRRFGSIPAVTRNFLFLIDGDALSRATPRTIEAGEAICAHLDQVRRARSEDRPGDHGHARPGGPTSR